MKEKRAQRGDNVMQEIEYSCIAFDVSSLRRNPKAWIHSFDCTLHFAVNIINNHTENFQRVGMLSV